MGIMTVREKYTINKDHECAQVFKTTDTEHPGVAKVMAQKEINLAGPVQVISEGTFPTEYKGIYMTPAESRKLFSENGKAVRSQRRTSLRSPSRTAPQFI